MTLCHWLNTPAQLDLGGQSSHPCCAHPAGDRRLPAATCSPHTTCLYHGKGNQGCVYAYPRGWSRGGFGLTHSSNFVPPRSTQVQSLCDHNDETVLTNTGVGCLDNNLSGHSLSGHCLATHYPASARKRDILLGSTPAVPASLAVAVSSSSFGPEMRTCLGLDSRAEGL